MDDLQFYVLFNSISIISGRWANDNERLCAMKSRERLRRFRLDRSFKLGNARSVGQRLTHRAIGTPLSTESWKTESDFFERCKKLRTRIHEIIMLKNWEERRGQILKTIKRYHSQKSVQFILIYTYPTQKHEIGSIYHFNQKLF